MRTSNHPNIQVPQRCSCQPGDCIDGKYTVESELGSGSFGQVFKVKDSNNQIFALKLLRLWDVVSDIREPLVARFEMEFRTGRIPSRNLVHSIDSGYLNGNPYFVMEYCSGGDISKHIGSKNCDFSRYALDILNGLNDLHVNGKVHRDLKPENVLLKADGTAALTDFGISGDKNRRLTERNIFGRPYQMFGTYAYMPPEQSNRAKGICTVLPTTDLFSFGVLMFHLITGELPFGRLEDQNDLAKYLINSQSGKWNKQLLMNVPEGEKWVCLIERCLVPSWKERIQSAQCAAKLIPYGNIPIISSHEILNANDDNDKCHEKGPFLTIMQGLEFGTEYNLDAIIARECRNLVTIGLGFENDIILMDFNESYTSHKHLTLEKCDGNQWILRDGQWNVDMKEWRRSTNGTWLNSSEVTETGTILTNGDIISAGDMKIRFNNYK